MTGIIRAGRIGEENDYADRNPVYDPRGTAPTVSCSDKSIAPLVWIGGSR